MRKSYDRAISYRRAMGFLSLALDNGGALATYSGDVFANVSKLFPLERASSVTVRCRWLQTMHG